MSDLLQSLLVSVCLGALIGMIRQWGEQRESDDSDGIAGLRTFALWALLGSISAFLADQHAPFIFSVALTLVGAQLALRSVMKSDSRVGLTTTTASLLVFIVGGLVHWNHVEAAIVLSAALMLLLGFKKSIHDWTRKFTPEDIRSTLQFVAITGVILPLVPDKGYGPYEAFNPYSMWLMVVLISGLGFVGYILMRLIGASAGIALTGLVGGLASSTATTLAFSRESKETPALSAQHAMAIVIACTVMLARVLVVLGFIHREIIAGLWLPFLIIGAPGIVYTLVIFFQKKPAGNAADTSKIANPLSLSIAIKFALIYGVVTFFVKAVSASNMAEGLLAVSFISGLTDMDAIALSVTNNLKEGTVATDIALRAIIVAAIANTLVKAGMSVALGSPQLKKIISIVLGTTIVAGAICLIFVG